jgi:hypothetical protein
VISGPRSSSVSKCRLSLASPPVRSAASQVEGERQAVKIKFQVDLGGEAAAREAERLAVLPPFAPAAETWARTMPPLVNPLSSSPVRISPHGLVH